MHETDKIIILCSVRVTEIVSDALVDIGDKAQVFRLYCSSAGQLINVSTFFQF